MYRRPVALKPALLLLALLGLALCPGPALAHRLEAEAVVRPCWQVQVESWFETGDTPHAARVEVFRGDNQLVTEGRLDDRGIFVFSFPEVASLRIVVSAGAGHRAEIRIPEEKLAHIAACTCVACWSPNPSPYLVAPLLVPIKLADSPPVLPEPIIERHAGVQWKNLLLGVSMLLAIAALAFQWRRLRLLRERNAQLTRQEPDGTR